MTYIVQGLDPTPYQALFGLPDDELAAIGVVRMRVTEEPGFPCRVTLEDCAIGERVLLINHTSHDVQNPYRASHAIFVKEGASKPARLIDAAPPVFSTRILSLRGFDADGMMVDAPASQPGDADKVIRELFQDRAIDVIHAHNATRGCFAARIERN